MQKTHQHHYGASAFVDDFLALADTGVFHAAAQIRNLSQPAFSRRIQQLEKLVGVQMFDRSSNPVGLTPAGQRFLIHAQRLQSQLTQAVNDARATATALNDPVRIVTTHTLAISYFPEWWRGVVRQHEAATARLLGQRAEACIQDVRDGTASFALLHSIPGDNWRNADDLRVLKLASDRLLPLVAPRYNQPPLNYLAYAPGTSFTEWTAHLLGMPHSVVRADAPVFESPASEVLKAMALAGFGMAYLPERLASDDIAAGYLQQVSGGLPMLMLDIVLVRSAKSKLPRFEEDLWQHFQSQPGAKPGGYK
jgi:DNA-binding transcriptional LysR family regulator